jgi:hypothetical protein
VTRAQAKPHTAKARSTQPRANLTEEGAGFVPQEWSIRSWFSYNPPVAERLERNALSVAILSLIQIATTPRFVMRSPEGLAMARAGRTLLPSVLLTCKLLARTDRDPDTALQAW